MFFVIGLGDVYTTVINSPVFEFAMPLIKSTENAFPQVSLDLLKVKHIHKFQREDDLLTTSCIA